jgi:hypothetical protein
MKLKQKIFFNKKGDYLWQSTEKRKEETLGTGVRIVQTGRPQTTIPNIQNQAQVNFVINVRVKKRTKTASNTIMQFPQLR